MTATLSQRLLETDLASGDFCIGEAKGCWKLAQPVTEQAWPAVFTFISAAERPNCPVEFLVRWDLDQYGSQSPSGAFWDAESNSFLAIPKWPKGKPGSVVEAVFKTVGWAAPGQGFYHPYDRKAMHNHVKWPAAHPQYMWTKENVLPDFISLVHRYLNSDDYLGC